ncbi:unnamed protein product [Owenia fusiformis]|uniref:Polysaccharide lyase family 8 central domain-containing protein n=1 Tax=Owenia fusiformis TaxID=6347 RepID=A0A8J1UE59_OWEFU|nr:unnamed protein product [Owenia fusiformis]
MNAGTVAENYHQTVLGAKFRASAMPSDYAGETHAISKSMQSVNLRTVNLDGSFSDIKYRDNKHAGSTPFCSHGERLARLLQAYNIRRPLNYFWQNTTTKRWIIKSWEYLAYDAPENKDWNWWGVQIATPRSLWPGLFLSKEFIPEKLYNDLIERYWTRVKVWDYARKDGKMSASNLANRAFQGLFEMYHQNEKKFIERKTEVMELLGEEIVNKSSYQGEGVGADYCIHVHNMHVGLWEAPYYNSHLRLMIYNGGYGGEYLKRFAQIIILFQNTTFQVGEIVLSEFFNMFLECHQYLCRGRTFEPTSVGRNIDDNQKVTFWAAYNSIYKVASALLQLGYRTKELDNAISRFLNHGPNEKTALVGNRALFASDMIVHHRIGYMASVRMFSSRTVRPETWIGRRTNNPNGYYTGDGFVSVLQNDNEFGKRYNEVFQYYDWEKIPGTTVLYSGNVPQEGMERVGTPNFLHHISNADFVGSASDGMYGAAAMVYDRPTVKFTMKKTWFFFDNEIVCMGSDISMRSGERFDTSNIITTLNQIVRYGPIGYSTAKSLHQYVDWNTTSELVQTRWIHHANIGCHYYTA